MESTQTDFKLKDIVVICRSCGLAFATSALVEIPPISDLDQVEADLHRVLPNAELRAALIAVCPDCHFASWTSTYTRVPLKVNVVPRSECPAAQKYALAVKTGRDNNMHPLDLAFIALNGCWAAREAGEPDDLWLELAAFEHARGLADNPLSAEEDGLGHLMMAEIWRQLRQFDRAIRHYDLALKDHSVPKELITRQRMLAQNSHSAPTSLPAAMVREVFIAVSSPDVIYEEVEELPVPPMPAQKPNEKLAAVLGVETSKPLTPPPVKRAATVSVTPQSSAMPSAPSAVPADRSAFVRESFPHTGNGQTGSSDDHDAYSDVLPAGKEHVVLPEAPAAAATAHNKVEARVHSHYFRRPSSPDAAAEPAADAWMSDYNNQQQPQPAAQPESFECDKWVAHTAAAMAAANNAQAVVPTPTDAEIEAFERYQNQVINTYVAAQASAVAVPPPVAPAPAPAAAPAAPAPAPMAPAASAGPAVVYSIEPTTLLPAYNDDEEEFDDEFEEDIPIEAIIPAITLTGDVNAAPLKKKKKRRRRDRFAVSAPQALAPAVNYASPPAQPVHAAQQAYPAAMPAASYAMSGGGGGGNYAAPSETYEPPQPQYSQPQHVQYSQPQHVQPQQQQVSHQQHQQPVQPVQQQPQVMDTDESGGAQMDVSDAVARVESYLALSQQARRINWLRGYRGN